VCQVAVRILILNERKSKLNRQEKIKALVDAIINEDYGKTVDHWKIASVIEESYGSLQYRQIVSRAKKELRDNGKMIVSVFGVGYRVVAPDEYVDQSAKCIEDGARRVDIGVKILANAPVKDMTQAGAQRYFAVSDKIQIVQAALHGAKVEIKMLSSKRENPLLKAVEG
jgi:hypothetical protein